MIREQEIATTIWHQIPIAIKMSCGARDPLTLDGGALRFKVGRMLEYVEIRLNGRDLYDVCHYKVNRSTYEKKMLEEMGDVDCEMLSEVVYHMVNR